MNLSQHSDRILEIRAKAVERLLDIQRALKAQGSHRDVGDLCEGVQVEEASGSLAGEAKSFNAIIDQCDHAIIAIGRGTYGVCGGCGRSIAAIRLQVLPFATTCTACQERYEGDHPQPRPDFSAPTFDSQVV